MHMSVQPWKRIAPTISNKIGYRTVVVKHFAMPSGLVVDRSIMNEDGWQAACAIVITADKQVVVARQFRPGPEKIFDEIPDGIVDAGETPEACVVREVLEETGYQAGKVEYLGVSYYDAYVNGDRHYFLLTDCTLSEAGASPTPDEDIAVRTISIAELIANAKKGLMTDPGAVLMAYDKLMELQ
jgi:ADP-ribose pyrophosphatase